MKTHKISSCFSCSKEEHCDLLDKMHESVGNIFFNSQIIIKKTNNIDCYSVVGKSHKQLFITCPAIEKWSVDDIKKVITKLYQSQRSMIVDDDCKKVEAKPWDSFNSQFKIRKLASILEITDPIKVKISNKLGARANSHSEIIINSYMLSALSLNELTFVLAHEKAHIDDGSFTEDILTLIDDCAQEVDSIIKAGRGFRKTLGGLLKVGLVGFGIYGVQSHANELSADIQAKLRLRSLGLPDDGAEVFFSRINHNISLGHPSSDFRKDILGKI